MIFTIKINDFSKENIEVFALLNTKIKFFKVISQRQCSILRYKQNRGQSQISNFRLEYLCEIKPIFENNQGFR